MSSSNSSDTLVEDDLSLDLPESDPLTPEIFAKLAGLQIIARTDEEDDYIQDSIQPTSPMTTATYSDSASMSDQQQLSVLSTTFKLLPKLDDSFFTPPVDLELKFLSRKASLPTSESTSASSSPRDSISWEAHTLPQRRPLTGNPRPFHTRSRSETGPGVLVPPGGTRHQKRGRFTITRETVESTHWRPRRTTGPSRFHRVSN